MRIDIISAVPELLESPFNYSIIKRAREKKLVEICVHNLRDYTEDKHRRDDDYAFGFGAGMVLQIEPVDNVISKLKAERKYDEIIYTSPDGQKFDQKLANRYSMAENLIILCGHYKGIDHRIDGVENVVAYHLLVLAPEGYVHLLQKLHGVYMLTELPQQIGGIGAARAG